MMRYDEAGRYSGAAASDPADVGDGRRDQGRPGTAPPVFDRDFQAGLLDLFRWRRDVRRFLADPLPPGCLERLVEIACLAPSVGLSQPWRFVGVETPEARSAIRAIFEECNADALLGQDEERAASYARLKLEGLKEAPCQFALFCDDPTSRGHGLGRRTMPETASYSAVLALHTLWLAARAEGLGLGWLSILDPARVCRALGVPADWTFIGYFCLGRPAEADEVPALERAGWERRIDPAAVLLRR